MGSKNTTKQEQTNAPWKPLQAGVTWTFDQVLNNIKEGKPHLWEGSAIASQSDETKNSLNNIGQLASSGANSGILQNGINTANNVMNGSSQNGQAMDTLSQLMKGLSLGQNPALSGMASQAANVAGGSAPGQQTYQDLMSSAANNPALANLQAMASGANIGKNPYLDQMVSNQQDKIADKLAKVTNPGIASQATAMGRKGSGAFANQLNSANATAANEMAKVGTDLYANQYNTDTANMMSANNMTGALYNAGQQNKLNAAQGADASYVNFNNLLSNLYGQQGNAYNQGAQNQIANAGVQTNAANSANASASNNATQQMNAANSAKDLYANQYLPNQMLGQVGAAKDQYAQEKLDSDINQYETKGRQEMEMLFNLINAYNGSPTGQISSTTTQKSSGLGSILGGLSSAVGLASKIPGLCDFRLKENIEFIKEVKGINIYKWNYIGDDVTYLGPIAQEMAVTHPTFVDVTPDGYYYITMDIVRKVA